MLLPQNSIKIIIKKSFISTPLSVSKNGWSWCWFFFWRWGLWVVVVVSGSSCGIITQLSFPKCICSCVCMGPYNLFLTITCLYCLFSSSSLSLCNQVNSYSQTWQLLEQDVICWDIYSSCSGIMACG